MGSVDASYHEIQNGREEAVLQAAWGLEVGKEGTYPLRVWGKQPVLEFAAGNTVSPRAPQNAEEMFGGEDSNRGDLSSMIRRECRQHSGQLSGLGGYRALGSCHVGAEGWPR